MRKLRDRCLYPGKQPILSQPTGAQRLWSGVGWLLTLPVVAVKAVIFPPLPPLDQVVRQQLADAYEEIESSQRDLLLLSYKQEELLGKIATNRGRIDRLEADLANVEAYGDLHPHVGTNNVKELTGLPRQR